MTVTHALTTRDVVTVEGDDAATYLQGQLSQDVAGLGVGESAATFVLAPQGKVDGWGRIHRTAPDAFEIDIDAGAGEAWKARLTRFLLRTKAAISVRTEVPTLSVRGLPVPEALAASALPAVGVGVVGFDVIGADASASAALPADAIDVGPAGLDALRIRAGVPAWGAELDADTIPATVGQWAIDASVSFTKGCYTGQELVARIDSRGGNVPRHLMGLVVDGPAPERGAEVLVGGSPAGHVTSSAADLGGSGSVALAFVPRSIEVGPEGIDADVAGTAARLRPLPLG